MDKKPFKDTKKTFKDDKKPYKGGEKPYRDDKKPYKGDKKPYGDDKKTYKDDKKPYSGDKKPYRDEKKPYSGDRKPYNGDKKPYSDDRKPYRDDRKTFDDDKKPYREGKKVFRDDDRELNENQVEGRNAILEVLKSGRGVEKIVVAKGNVEGTVRRIMAMAMERGIVVQQTERSRLDEISQTKNHQGIIGFVAAHEYVEISEILDIAKQKGEAPFIIVLDGITDPHNLGAILRTADASGAHGVIIPKRRSVGLTATVSKTSAGAIEYVAVAKVINLSTTIDELKKEGLWIACADVEGKDYFESDLKGPLALVIGAEGEGVSRLVSEKCDFKVSIPMKGQISSLNASVAAGLLMYEVVRQRKS